jgi:hypothetical protein
MSQAIPADTEVPSFRSRVVCAKCRSRGNKIDVRPNRKEQPPQASLTRQSVSLMAHWRVDVIRKRAEHLGTVEAATEKKAVEKAAKQFDIPPERLKQD